MEKKYTPHEIKTLLFWAQFGAENAAAGQYQRTLSKLIPELEWGSRMPKNRDAHMADTRIKELEEEAAEYLRKYKQALIKITSLRQVSERYLEHMKTHDPLRELINP